MRAILTYHSIDPSGSPVSVDERVFRRQVRWLASGGVRVVPLDELPNVPAAVDAVALTFDDGFRNFGEVAAPLLREYGLPATLFVVSDHVGGTNAWGGVAEAGVPTLPLLDWDALGRLAEGGGVTLGAHGRRHVRLAGLGDAELEDEVVGSAARLAAETGRRPAAFAYPYGTVDPRAATAVALAYALGCGTELRTLRAREAPSLLPRIDMYYLRRPGRLESWGSARFRCYLHVRARARRVRQYFAALDAT